MCKYKTQYPPKDTVKTPTRIAEQESLESGKRDHDLLVSENIANVSGLPSIENIIQEQRPSDPIHCIHESVITQNAKNFVTQFFGRVLYAVKCNPDPSVIRAVHAGGVNHFDVASLHEIHTLHTLLPQTTIHFMHPIKPRSSIRRAYWEYGVRTFAFDSLMELKKIREETQNTPDLSLFLRIALPPGGARLDLSGKFGVSQPEASVLLRQARQYTSCLGICFHVGSQCTEPQAFSRALEIVEEIICSSEVQIDVVDVGGGFPVAYPDCIPPRLEHFFEVIERYRQRFSGCRFWSEPGRSLVASGGSLVVQVLARRQNSLFLNDGVFGNLADAGEPHCFCYPVHVIRPDKEPLVEELKPFSFFGPTCDGTDKMPGPFWLPDNVAEGEWILIGQLGAYSTCMRTRFNGFGATKHLHVMNPPLSVCSSTPHAA